MPRSKTKSKSGPAPLKRDFILKFGLDKPTASILSAAKKAGIILTSSYVYELRKRRAQGSQPAAAKRGPGRPPKVSAPAPTPAAKRGPGRPPKAAAAPAKKAGSGPAPLKRDFIMKFGLDKPTASILSAAKAAGIVLTSSYVYELRKRAKGGRPAAAAPKRGPGRPPKSAPKAAAPAPAKRGPGRPPKAASSGSGGGNANADKAFRAAVAQVVLAGGIAHARALLEQVAAKIRAAAGLVAAGRPGAKCGASGSLAPHLPRRRRRSRDSNSRWVAPRRFSNRAAVPAPGGTGQKSAQIGASETKVSARNGTEGHPDQALDQSADQRPKPRDQVWSGTAAAVLAAVSAGDAASFELARALVREVLDDPLVKRARALEELLEARSPFALVRTVELAELMASGAEGEDASATKEGAG